MLWESGSMAADNHFAMRWCCAGKRRVAPDACHAHTRKQERGAQEWDAGDMAGGARGTVHLCVRGKAPARQAACGRVWRSDLRWIHMCVCFFVVHFPPTPSLLVSSFFSKF